MKFSSRQSLLIKRIASFSNNVKAGNFAQDGNVEHFLDIGSVIQLVAVTQIGYFFAIDFTNFDFCGVVTLTVAQKVGQQKGNEGYTYHEETNEITLDYMEPTEDMVTTILIVHESEDVLELDFNGEIRTFEREIRLGTQ